MAQEQENKAIKAGIDVDSPQTLDERTIDTITLAQEATQDAAQEESVSTFLLFRFPSMHWKMWVIFFGISLSILFHWFSTSELFSVPEDVATSRACFMKAKESYFQNSTYWDAKQRHFTEKLSEQMSVQNDFDVLRMIQEIPPEVFVSFMWKKLHLSLDRLEKTAVYLRDDTSNCSLIISKPETSIWPVTIMLALELDVKVHLERFSLTVSRLRRGSQDIALGLAWTYFGPELESIRQLESTSKQSFILLSADSP